MSKFDDILDSEIKKYQKTKISKNDKTKDQTLEPSPLNAKHLIFKANVEKILKTKK